MTNHAILLDTCAVLWLAMEEPMAEPALDALGDAYAAGIPVMISPITAWEIGLLASRGRIASPLSPQAILRKLTTGGGLKFAEISPDLLIASSFLPGRPPRDPADRIIITTAREFALTVMTRDSELLQYSAEGHLSALPC